jgi:hypothetical protein
MTQLTDEQTKRLVKLLGMTGSAYDGERSNAAAKANELIRSAGLTWEQYLTGGRSLKAPPSGNPQGFAGPPRRNKFSYEEGRQPFAFVGKIIHESPKAVLVDAGLADGAIWIPKSQIIDQQPHKADPSAHIFGIPKWLADAKGLLEWNNV